MNDLGFREFSAINRARSAEDFRTPVEEWSLVAWGCALAGEVGELCNVLKKLHRGDEIGAEEAYNAIADELADIITYADLLAERAGIEDLGYHVRRKFNEVSKRVGSAKTFDLTAEDMTEQSRQTLHRVSPKIGAPPIISSSDDAD